MKALQLNTYGPPGTDTVELVDIDEPRPGAGQVAVAVDFAPINPSDFLLIMGRYGVRPTLPTVLGAEGVGHIVAVGDGVDEARVGEQVLVVPTLKDPTWCETTVVDAGRAIAVEGDPAQLAMLGINPMTAWAMLHGVVDIEPGSWVLQTGATSATAGYVRALAARAGFRLIEVVRRPESVAALREAGAEYVVAEGPDAVGEVRAILGQDTVDLLVDAVGGDGTVALGRVMSPGGHIVTYSSRTGGPVAIGLPDLVFKGVTMHGFWLLNWVQGVHSDRVAEHYRELAGLVADGTLHAAIEATYSLEDFGRAFEHAGRRGRTGKVLFSPGN
ncbi:trans-2-enoyl-CoA reductase [Rhodococcoides trifolii]|uniref:enoyl-[acyl-carrier-protein] reductase n=1 Tax=Rhodococcoides trifolii TaxID=908250 RepID=A0A917LHK9_9NOCA|nr:zinc-dependent alcohol dehydrogenase family protein [Rhodococcus trifolii]GGG25395.1 trans-2-enoyl-CoA reductase [Rhodococcus trifolii]